MRWPTTQAERDQRLIEIKSQRARGMTLADIGARHDITQVRVGQILARERSGQILQIERDLQDIEWMLMDPIHRAVWRTRIENYVGSGPSTAITSE